MNPLSLWFFVQHEGLYEGPFQECKDSQQLNPPNGPYVPHLRMLGKL